MSGVCDRIRSAVFKLKKFGATPNRITMNENTYFQLQGQMTPKELVCKTGTKYVKGIFIQGVYLLIEVKSTCPDNIIHIDNVAFLDFEG